MNQNILYYKTYPIKSGSSIFYSLLMGKGSMIFKYSLISQFMNNFIGKFF